MAPLSTAWAIFQGLLLEALPFLLLGVAISGLARWLLPQTGWIRLLPRQPFLAPVVGALMGFALPACECGNVPIARRLFAAPVLNPIVIASTWAAFPDQPWLLIARPCGAFLIALALTFVLRPVPEHALLTDALLEERRLSQPLEQVGLLERRSGMLGASAIEAPLPAPARLAPADLLAHSSREFLDLLSLLVVGCAIAASVQTFLPRSWLLAVGEAPTLSILALMLMAVVISVCSSVDAFLALGFAAQVTPGALLAFLLLGPVVDLKLAGLFTVVLKPRAIAMTALAAAMVVLLMGQWVNLLLL